MKLRACSDILTAEECEILATLDRLDPAGKIEAPPSAWPKSTDAFRWTLGPAPTLPRPARKAQDSPSAN